jgi:hypothetical protein
MIEHRQKPVKDYLARGARTIFVPTFSQNGTTPAKQIKVASNFVKVI